MAREGELRASLGAWSLGAAVFNTVVGAGIFVLPAALARSAGAAAPLAYLACTIIMGSVALCFAAAGSRVPTSGGPYGYAEAAFGPLAGFLVGLLVWVGSVLAAAGITAAIADAAASAVPLLRAPEIRAALIVALLGGLAVVNGRGAAAGSRVVGGLTVLKLAPLLLLLVGGGVALALGRAPAQPVAPPTPGGFGRAMLLAIFAFQGMETALGVSGEVRDPARSIPRGLLAAMAAVAVLYMGLQGVAQGLLGAGLSGSTAPLAAAGAVVWRPLGGLLLAGAVASMLGYLASDALSAPRTLFAFGRAGVLPSVFARASPSTGTPTVAILAHLSIAAVLALTGGFVELATLSALAVVAVYIVGCAAAVVLQRRGTVRAGAPFVVPHIWIAAFVGTVGMVWLALNARPMELAGLAATTAAGAVLFLVRRRGVMERPASD